jgi:hypothetical protein
MIALIQYSTNGVSSMYSGRDLCWPIWIVVVYRRVIGVFFDVDIPQLPTRCVRDESTKTLPVDPETSLFELGVNHDFAVSQINDCLEIVRQCTPLSSFQQKSDRTKSAEDLSKNPLLLLNGKRCESLHGFLLVLAKFSSSESMLYNLLNRGSPRQSSQARSRSRHTI